MCDDDDPSTTRRPRDDRRRHPRRADHRRSSTPCRRGARTRTPTIVSRHRHSPGPPPTACEVDRGPRPPEHVGGHGYRLGPRLLQIRRAALQEPSLRDIASPCAGTPRVEHRGERSALFVAGLGERVCVDSVESSSELRTFVKVGAILPMRAGSAGKVFLAWMSPSARQELMANARSLTPATPTKERLAQQVATVKARGWAISVGEREEGVGSVSAPVFGPAGELVAVVSVSGPSQPGQPHRREALRARGHDRCARGRSRHRRNTHLSQFP